MELLHDSVLNQAGVFRQRGAPLVVDRIGVASAVAARAFEPPQDIPPDDRRGIVRCAQLAERGDGERAVFLEQLRDAQRLLLVAGQDFSVGDAAGVGETGARSVLLQQGPAALGLSYFREDR